MHPIERLRYVARIGDEPGVVDEAAGALASFAGDQAGLVAAARRLVVRHRSSGPMWTMAARLVLAAEVRAEAEVVRGEMAADPVPAALAAALPDEASVLVVGWAETVLAGLLRRGDVSVLAVDDGSGVAVARVLGRADVEVVDVPAEGVGAAAASVDLVVLEAMALGPDALVAAPGSRAAAAVARHAGRTVWAATPWGSIVGPEVYAAGPAAVLAARPHGPGVLDEVPLDLVDRVLTGDGPVAVADAVRAVGPTAPELLRAGSTPGTHLR